MAEAVYLDASALVKLAVAEEETAALAGAHTEWTNPVSSLVSAVEVRLAVERATHSRIASADEVLDPLALIPLNDDVVARASRFTALRTLDAIHLASALSLGSELSAFVAYDRRLFAAARAAGLRALAPGQSPRGA